MCDWLLPLVTHPFWLDSLIAFGTAAAVAFAVGQCLSRSPFFQLPFRRDEGDRSSVQPRYFRLGGVILAAGFFAALALDERLVWDAALRGLVFGALGALVLGLLDDFLALAWWQQLLGQLVLGGIVVQAGTLVTELHIGAGAVLSFAHWAWLPVFATLLWMLIVMNAVNWLDGTDGLMGSVVGVALLVIAILSARPEVNQPTLILIALMLLGAVIGFLAFNWHPAQLVAGSSGALFVGFFIGMLSIYAGAKIATVLIVLALPFLDFFSVILTRIWHGRSPFLPDRSHLHHILLSFGWAPRSIAFLYIFLTELMGFLALSTRSWEKLWVLVVASIIFMGVLAWMQWMLRRQYHRD